MAAGESSVSQTLLSMPARMSGPAASMEIPVAMRSNFMMTLPFWV